jgi:hypothetical protein
MLPPQPSFRRVENTANASFVPFSKLYSSLTRAVVHAASETANTARMIDRIADTSTVVCR